MFMQARVCGDALVYENAKVCENAEVSGDAIVDDNAQVSSTMVDAVSQALKVETQSKEMTCVDAVGLPWLTEGESYQILQHNDFMYVMCSGEKREVFKERFE